MQGQQPNYSVGETSAVFSDMRSFGAWYGQRDAIIKRGLAVNIPKSRIADTMGLSQSVVDRVEKMLKGASR